MKQRGKLAAAEFGSGEEVARQARECTLSPELLRLRVLSWRLSPGHARWPELAALLGGWEWDVAALRGLPRRWPAPLARALDAEFRCAPAHADGNWGGSWLRRLLSSERLPAGPATTAGDAIVARRDRIASEWPPAARRAPRTGLHMARLACGIWVGNQHGGEPGQPDRELSTVIGDDEALVVTGARAGMTIDLPGRPLAVVADDGEDAIWATTDLVPVAPAKVLAGGAAGGRPPFAVTLKQRPLSGIAGAGPG